MNITHTVRLDQCPPGLVHVPAHGEIPGGLAMKDTTAYVYSLSDDPWRIKGSDLADFEGIPMTAIPTEIATASTDPRISAYTKEH